MSESLGRRVDGPSSAIGATGRAIEGDRGAERDAWAVLAGVDGLGPAGMRALLEALGDARSSLHAAASVGGPGHLVAAARSRGHRLPEVVAVRVAEAAASAPAYLARLRALGVGVITLADATYPTRLRGVDQPPPVLFVAGDVAVLNADDVVAMVGTRRPTERGRRIAAALAGAVARAGAVVVSGLAIGIDGVAHEATLGVGGRTVAVLGGGHARLYPRVHGRLAQQIVERGGAVVSELPPDVDPVAGTFPRRNRVISGLSDATVIVEARARSGALITAGWALEQGRPCFAVPGPLDVEQSLGCNRLLRLYPGEARAVSSVEELIEDLGLDGAAGLAGDASGGPGWMGEPGRDGGAAPPGAGGPSTATRRAAAVAVHPGGRPAASLAGASTAAILAGLSPPERAVARALMGAPATVDDLVRATDLAPASVLVVLTRLEERGHVTAILGRYAAAGSLAAGPLVARDRQG